MSQLSEGQDVKYRIFKAKIVDYPKDMPLVWYKDRVGKTITIQERAYYQDGNYESSSYWANATEGLGFNGSIDKEHFEETV